MKKIRAFSLGCATLGYLAAIGLSAAQPAFAEGYKPNTKNNEPTREQIEEHGWSGVLPMEAIQYSFIYDPKAGPDELTFRALIPLEVQGCYNVYDAEVESEIVGKSLNIEAKMPIVTTPYSTYTKPDCKLSNSFSADTKIDRRELIDKGINKIRLKTRFGTVMRDLIVTEHMISIVDVGDKRIRPYTYWTLPENAVVLSVPMFKGNLLDRDTQLQQVARVGKIKKLIPIEEEVENYEPAQSNINRFIFLDTRGDIVGLLKENNEPIRVGQVHIKEPFYGPNGTYDKEVGLDIIATLPQSND